MSKLNGYSKIQKLKSRKAMETLFASGKSLNAFPIKVFYTLEPIAQKGTTESIVLDTITLMGDTENTAVKENLSEHITITDSVHAGVGVSSRNFKKAVDRNRIKRLLREVYRTQKQALIKTVSLRAMDLNVFFLFVGKELPEYPALKLSMEKTLEKLVGRINEISKQ